MALVNENFLRLPGSYLFAEIAKKIAAHKSEYPNHHVISLGIGDVTQPLAPVVIKALQDATLEMASEKTMRGYAPDQGYPFLVNAILKNDFEARGISLDADEIFVSDGAKSDTGNIGDILSADNIIAITDPVYPVYVDTNVMAGRAGTLIDGRWSNIEYLDCTAENNFIPELPKQRVDVVYLCYPNNPTGTTLTRTHLKAWVDYALANEVLLLYDAAYEAFITDPEVPHSIYEIEGAKQCAIEFHSFSKTAGFTGLRCAYTVVPKELKAYAQEDADISLNTLWKRRQSTKFNGTAYIVQRAAEATYSPEGKQQIRAVIDYYMENARTIKSGLETLNMKVYGGVNAPYIWAKTPYNKSSWEYFDFLLHHLHIVTTPGSGFGKSGEGYIRLTAFGNRNDTLEAVNRMVNN
ncbi:MAG: LL-diaminopimelate aminotransferase [Bacteroidales bacterium]|jgi:LL-diaminopimelate aminotransferase|nr:LL-diaminopimelate aminotransferase [Bacteroidales bacterium]